MGGYNRTFILVLRRLPWVAGVDEGAAEIVETTLGVSWFHFLRVGSRISELHVIILLGMQILKVGSRIFLVSKTLCRI